MTANPSRREIVVATPEPASGSEVKPNAAMGAARAASKTYVFDGVFGPDATQADVYDSAIEPIVAETLEGFNCTVFAYGQTGTGKTHTMQGADDPDDPDDPDVDDFRLDSAAGITPRALAQIFGLLNATRSRVTEYSVRCTFLELYNEEISDLLCDDVESSDSVGDGAEKKKKTHRLMEDGRGGVSVEGLTEVTVTSFAEALRLARLGTERRRKAATRCNAHSSRSHAVFSASVRLREPSADEEGEDLIKLGKLNRVDLAGSENVGKSGVAERGATARSREAGEINKSLLTLGRVVTALVDKLAHVPYRDSKLTRLLRDALGGKSKTCIVATVGPSLGSVEETVATAEYASRARSVRCKPEVNRRVTKNALARELRREVETLRADLDATRRKNGVFLAPETFEAEETKKAKREERLKTLELALREAEQRRENDASLFEASERARLDLERRLDETQASARAASETAEKRLEALESLSAETQRTKRETNDERVKREAAELENAALLVRLSTNKTQTRALFDRGDRFRAREKETAAALAEARAEADSAAARLERAETALVEKEVELNETRRALVEREKQSRERAFEAARREIECARDAATRACDAALAALRGALATNETDSDESSKTLPETLPERAELSAAAAAARAALAAAAAVAVPADTPSGATPTRATAAALAPPTPEAEGGSLAPTASASATKTPAPPAAAAEMRATRAKTSSLPRAPLRDLGENVEEAA